MLLAGDTTTASAGAAIKVTAAPGAAEVCQARQTVTRGRWQPVLAAVVAVLPCSTAPALTTVTVQLARAITVRHEALRLIAGRLPATL